MFDRLRQAARQFRHQSQDGCNGGGNLKRKTGHPPGLGQVSEYRDGTPGSFFLSFSAVGFLAFLAIICFVASYQLF